MTLLDIDGFHGTSSESAELIQKSSFNESNSETEWLGHGVYFFVDGVSDPLENAKEWAKAQAYDRKTETYKYVKYSVLKSKISLEFDRLIDLTNTDGIRKFNSVKELLFEKIFKNFDSEKIPGDRHNCMMFNFVVATLGANGVKHNLYIKSIRERKIFLRLNVPNTTVLCVLKKHFDSNSTQVYLGEIT